MRNRAIRVCCAPRALSSVPHSIQHHEQMMCQTPNQLHDTCCKLLPLPKSFPSRLSVTGGDTHSSSLPTMMYPRPAPLPEACGWSGRRCGEREGLIGSRLRQSSVDTKTAPQPAAKAAGCVLPSTPKRAAAAASAQTRRPRKRPVVLCHPRQSAPPQRRALKHAGRGHSKPCTARAVQCLSLSGTCRAARSHGGRAS